MTALSRWITWETVALCWLCDHDETLLAKQYAEYAFGRDTDTFSKDHVIERLREARSRMTGVHGTTSARVRGPLATLDALIENLSNTNTDEEFQSWHSRPRV